MRIHMSVRPKGVLKRGVTTKKWHQAIGFERGVGLFETVGCLEFNADDREDQEFLLQLANVFPAWRETGYTLRIFDAEGKEVAMRSSVKREEEASE